jgi:hypothetical protein
MLFATARLISARASAVITTLGEGVVEHSVLRRVRLIFWRNAVHRIDVSDDRRTAESVLAIEADEIPDVVAELAKSKRLSVVMGNLNRLMQHPIDQELGRRALRHLGFLDD